MSSGVSVHSDKVTRKMKNRSLSLIPTAQASPTVADTPPWHDRRFPDIPEPPVAP